MVFIFNRAGIYNLLSGFKLYALRFTLKMA